MIMYEHDGFFPDEAFDDIAETEVSAHPMTRYGESPEYTEFVARLRQNAQEVTGVESGKFTLEQQQELATLIQQGRLYRELADMHGVGYTGEYDDYIAAGDEAKYRLVTANLPFAAYFARISMGRNPSRSTTETIGVQRYEDEYMGMLKKPGTYAPLDQLSHPRANIEDRTQVAIEAMWGAAEKYRPSNAKFITFAAWHIQQALARYRATEVGGWDFPAETFQKYRNALADEALYGTFAPIQHIGADGKRRTGNHPSVVFEGRKSVPLESAGNWTAPEEIETAFSTGDLDIADVTQTSGYETTETEVFEEFDGQTIVQVMDTVLDERQTEIMKKRYGFDEAPMTLDEIAEEYGVTRERVRQIIARGTSLLRQSKFVKDLARIQATQTEEIIPNSLLPLVDGAAHIKTRPLMVGKKTQQEIAPPQVLKERWQIHPDESWDDFPAA